MKGLHIFFIGLLLLVGSSKASGQAVAPFTVLTTNMDTTNRKFYLEIMYEKPACSDYQARFRMDSKKGKGDFVKVDSFLNNVGTFVNQGDSVLQRPTAGGYKLRFNLPNNISVADSPYICIVSQVIPYECVGCVAAESKALFSSLNIDTACPYIGKDLIACRWVRDRWMGWIQDPRDCKPYGIVMMPDGRWWFTKNLNYQKDLIYSTLQSSSNLHTAVSRGEFFCPNGFNVSSANTGSINVAITNSTGGGTYNYSKDNSSVPSSSCNTYGALYTWNTAMALNGRTAVSSAAPSTEPSSVQGICPDGWYLPNTYDWNQLIIPNSLPMGISTITKMYKAQRSCYPHASVVDSVCATYDNPAWAWRRMDYNGKVSSPYALGQDNFGFGLVPNGYIAGSATTTDRYYHRFGLGAYLWLSSETGSNGDQGMVGYEGTLGNANMVKYNAAGVRCISGSILRLSIPSKISYKNASFPLVVESSKSGGKYSWRIESKDITSVDSKITIADNNTETANNTVAAIKNITALDTTKKFMVVVALEIDGEKRTFYKEIEVVECVMPVIKVHPRTQSFCGTEFTLAVVAEDVKYYQWRRNGVDVSNGANLNSSTYKGSTNEMANYTVLLRDETGACEVESHVATITPDPTSAPLSCGICTKVADAGTVNYSSSRSACPSGWRLPTTTELQCMYNNRGTVPVTASNHWSSNTYSGSSVRSTCSSTYYSRMCCDEGRTCSSYPSCSSIGTTYYGYSGYSTRYDHTGVNMSNGSTVAITTGGVTGGSGSYTRYSHTTNSATTNPCRTYCGGSVWTYSASTGSTATCGAPSYSSANAVVRCVRSN